MIMNSHINKAHILVASLVALFASQCFGSDIPFTLEKGLIVVKAKIKKVIPVDVVIATGSQTSHVSMDFVLRNKIVPGYTADRNGEALLFVDVIEIILGDEKPVSLKMKGSSLESSYMKTGREIAASLGADFFKGKILQIDFKKRLIRFLNAPAMDYKEALTTSGLRDKKVFVFRMDQVSENFLGQPVVMPVIDGPSINGVTVRSLLDTLTPYPVTLSPDAIKQFGFGSIPDKGTTKPAKLKSFSLGSMDFTDVPAILAGKNAGFDESYRDYGAIIGVAVLQNFTVTFDWKNKMVVLESA